MQNEMIANEKRRNDDLERKMIVVKELLGRIAQVKELI